MNKQNTKNSIGTWLFILLTMHHRRNQEWEGGYKKDSYILNLFAQTKQYSVSVSWTLYAGHTEYINSYNTTNQI